MAPWLRCELAAHAATLINVGSTERLMERQRPVVDQTSSRDRHLRGLDLGKGQGLERIDQDLGVDLADPFELAPEEGVLV